MTTKKSKFYDTTLFRFSSLPLSKNTNEDLSFFLSQTMHYTNKKQLKWFMTCKNTPDYHKNSIDTYLSQYQFQLDRTLSNTYKSIKLKV